MARKRAKAKEAVKIRFKKLSNGNKSIYLDIYQDGKRTYDFLKLYLIPEATPEAKTQNGNTMQVATAIKSQRILDITNGKAGITSNKKSKITLIEWMEQCREAHARNGKKVYKTYMCVLKVLQAYKDGKILLKDIDEKYCIGLYHYMLTTPTAKTHKPFAKNTIALYCACLNMALEKAVQADIISVNPYKKIASSDKVRGTESTREYLTIDELKKMANTPCSNEIIKRAYMFACFCGLRLSDIEKLTWASIMQADGQYRIETVMQKTQRPIYLPLSGEALQWLPKRYDIEDETRPIFLLPCRMTICNVLKKWATDAGITKNISFHTSRHTFATTMLTLGADLYTTSKLLGHTNVETTQIYAKIIDQKKTDAVNLMNGILS